MRPERRPTTSQEAGDELHYRRLRAELKRLGADERDYAGLGVEELANFKTRFVDQMMREAA